MPSIFRATVGLDQESWEWHKRNPGHLSQICQERIYQEIALDSLPDGLRDDALEAATVAFFDDLAPRGDYAIMGQDLTRHDATEADMVIDAEWLGIRPENLLATLQDLFDLEMEMQLRKRALLRAAREVNVKH